MLGITLHRPWDVLVGRGIKTIENRSWAPDTRLAVGERLAIHAGLKWDDRCVAMAQRLGVGLQTFEGQHVKEAIVAVVRFAGAVTESDNPWFFGPPFVGWVLEDSIALARPVPCRGAQKLWALPPLVEMEVLAQCRGR